MRVVRVNSMDIVGISKGVEEVVDDKDVGEGCVGGTRVVSG